MKDNYVLPRLTLLLFFNKIVGIVLDIFIFIRLWYNHVKFLLEKRDDNLFLYDSYFHIPSHVFNLCYSCTLICTFLMCLAVVIYCCFLIYFFCFIWWYFLMVKGWKNDDKNHDYNWTKNCAMVVNWLLYVIVIMLLWLQVLLLLVCFVLVF